MDSFFSALITLHSISVTHHSSLRIPHPVWHHHSLVITQYFLTVCGLHTCHLVKAKLFCGPHHFLFSHFPTFTPVTLPKHNAKKRTYKMPLILKLYSKMPCFLNLILTKLSFVYIFKCNSTLTMLSST